MSEHEELVAVEPDPSRDRERFIPEHPITNKISIPESWGTVKDFAKWWFFNNMPFAPPIGYEVYLSDDATSFCMFRHDRFQVELYLIYPNPNLPLHEHPGVEVIKYQVPHFPQSPEQQWETTNILKDGEVHGEGRNFKETKGYVDKGVPLLAFQRWDEGLEMTTVASRWKGKTVGPKQEDLMI